MSDDTADRLTPAEQIVADVSAGKLTHENATLQLLAEIANGIWYLVTDVDELLEMARDNGEVPGRVH